MGEKSPYKALPDVEKQSMKVELLSLIINC